jgi:NAD dependent epimerase/dehydratase
MKNILVTGAGGFIGSHLTESLVEQGYNVKAFIHYNSMNSWGWIDSSKIKESIKIIPGDIRDYDAVSNAVKDCDTVFHLAALIGIPYSYISPLAYIRTNIEGTYNILESSKLHNLENILVTSTSETYGTAKYVPMDENHPTVGQSPYSATKISADQLAISYHRSFDMPIKLVRPFNTYGPRQSARAIIPTVISQILKGSKSIELGNLSPTRDLNYVLDTVSGFIEISKREIFSGCATNIGSNTEISVHDLIKIIIKLIGEEVELIIDNDRIRPAQSEVERLYADNTKLLSNSDWQQKYSLEDGLMLTIEWIKNNLKKFKTELYNV